MLKATVSLLSQYIGADYNDDACILNKNYDLKIILSTSGILIMFECLAYITTAA